MTALFYAYMDSPIGRLLMLSDGEHLTNLDCELEQTTPNPNWILRDDLPLFEKVAEKVKIISEVEFAYKLAKAPIFAVTGTNGKTTTTMLLGELMKTIYGEDNVGVGGNIGTPLCEECYRIGENGCIVAEISSYQMEASSDFATKGAAILNVTPDHLARHKTMEVYQAEKEKVFAHHTD